MIDFNLYLITDRKQARAFNFLEAIEKALVGGVRAVQLREKDLSSRSLYDTALAVRSLTSLYGAKLLINDRVDIALAADADGVHLGGESMPVSAARKILGSGKLIGASCHDRSNALSAEKEGADFITFSPVYYTPSKAPYGEPVGIAALADAARLLHIPVFALGGIKRENVREVIAAGAQGIALISAVIAAHDPAREAAELLSLLPDLKQ
ncbi:MAG: thiamine-phosphate diphosphorylase [Geobacteraceae bacterium]|jgi:thiamine-phosphate pyrophosphorylase|nr:thiamine-phosphate diphosphorylase [Geobacteraceae bacterium]